MASRLTSFHQRVLYHSSRITLYAAFGAVAGALGASVFSEEYGGVGQRIALVLVASCTIAWLLRHFTAVASPRLLKSSARTSRPEWMRALLFGVGTVLLPCGWLHLFVAVAATSAHPVRGALLMVAFGLGTIPGLAASEVILQKLGTRFRKRVSFALLALSVVAVMLMKTVPLLRAQSSNSATSCQPHALMLPH